MSGTDVDRGTMTYGCGHTPSSTSRCPPSHPKGAGGGGGGDIITDDNMGAQ